MKSKTQKLILGNHGSYLGMEKGCFVVKDKHGKVERYPVFEKEIGEVILKSGNAVSTGALASMGFWGIDVVILTQKGNPVAVLKNIDDDSHVKTRIAQYEALKNGRGIDIAKQITESRIESQNVILRKHGLEQHDLMKAKKKIKSINNENLKTVRKKLIPIEGIATEFYFKQIFQLFPESLRIEKRKTFKAYDGINNTLNLAYTILKYKVHSAILKAHLEPFLGFIHSEQFGKPSLVCDFQELYRYLIDDFLVEFSQSLKKKDFRIKWKHFSSNRKGKREILDHEKTKQLTESLNQYFQSKVEIPRIRHGKRQTIETLINEEAYLFAKYLRNEKDSWKPRIPTLNN